jgi:carboxylesterase
MPNIFQHADLDGSSFYWSGNNTGIILIHGFTATTVEVRPMAKFLNDFGFTVAGPLLPGHGHTPEDMNKVSYSDWINAVEETYQKLASNCEKVFVLGESMGSLLSIMLCVMHPEIAGALLFAPALQVSGIQKALFVWPFKSYVFKKNVDETMEWQGFNVVPLHAAAQLAKLQIKVKHSLSKMTTPTMIFQGRLDHSINPMSSVIVLESINSKEKELIWLEESTHCILLDQQLPDVEVECLDFIRAHK